MTATPGSGRDDLDELERKHAENPEGRYFVPLANAYRRAGALERAIGVLRTGLESHPDYLSARVVLGRCLLDAGREQDAASEFRYVLSLDSQNLIALRTLGDLALAAGEMEEGRARYRELLEVDPLNPEARAALDAIATESDAVDAPGMPDPLDAPVTPETPAAPEVRETPDEPEHDDEPFDDVEYASGEIAPAAPENGDEDHDALFGTMINLDEGPDSPESGDGDAVVTETIAELYTRQGFYDRAAGVYRELIRRRGAEDRLVRALERVEALASGGAGALAEGVHSGEMLSAAEHGADEGADGESPAVESPEEGAAEEQIFDPLDVMGDADAAIPAAVELEVEEEEEEGGLVEEAEVVEEAGIVAEPAGYGAPPPENPVEHDPFADSFADGFPAMEDAEDEEFAGVGVAAVADRSPGGSEGPPESSSTIRDLFASVVGWSAHGGADSETFVAAEHADAGDATASDADATVVGDDVLFPWELPEGEREASSAELSADAGGSPEVDEALPPGDEVELEPVESAPSTADADEAHEPLGSEMAAQPGPAEEASTAEDEDDDDLESFQEWLRSLRR